MVTSLEPAHPALSSTTHPVLAGAWTRAVGPGSDECPDDTPNVLPSPPFHAINTRPGSQPGHTHTHTTRITLSMDISSLHEKHEEPGPLQEWKSPALHLILSPKFQEEVEQRAETPSSI